MKPRILKVTDLYRKCAECGGQFLPTTHRNTICSDVCRKRRNSRNQRKWYKENLKNPQPQKRRPAILHDDVYLHDYHIGANYDDSGFILGYRQMLQRELDESNSLVNSILRNGVPVGAVHDPPLIEITAELELAIEKQLEKMDWASAYETRLWAKDQLRRISNGTGPGKKNYDWKLS